jgi:hypothetical protein
MTHVYHLAFPARHVRRVPEVEVIISGPGMPPLGPSRCKSKHALGSLRKVELASAHGQVDDLATQERVSGESPKG